jgi:hypothetical protein
MELITVRYEWNGAALTQTLTPGLEAVHRLGWPTTRGRWSSVVPSDRAADLINECGLLNTHLTTYLFKQSDRIRAREDARGMPQWQMDLLEDLRVADGVAKWMDGGVTEPLF